MIVNNIPFPRKPRLSRLLSIGTIRIKKNWKHMDNNNISFRIFGYIMILWGIVIWFKPAWYSGKYQTTFDFSEIKGIFCTCLFIYGGTIIWLSHRKKAKEKDTRREIPQKTKKRTKKRNRKTWGQS
jgi:hypothetical protein